MVQFLPPAEVVEVLRPDGFVKPLGMPYLGDSRADPSVVVPLLRSGLPDSFQPGPIPGRSERSEKNVKSETKQTATHRTTGRTHTFRQDCRRCGLLVRSFVVLPAILGVTPRGTKDTVPPERKDAASFGCVIGRDSVRTP